MSKIPTAEEICNKQFFGFKGELWVGVHKAMVEFAKLHVEAALEEAEKETVKHIPKTILELNMYNKNSILKSYPLENIK